MSYTDLTNVEDEDEYLKQSVEIIPEAIREEFVRVPADLAYWGERYADAVKTFLVAEQECKLVRARVRMEIREVQALGTRKLTEADVDAYVEQHADYQAAKAAEIETEAAKLSAKVRLDSVSAKKDMCMSLGAYIRAEMAPSQLNRNS